MTFENWRQNQDNWKFNQDRARHLEDELRHNEDSWRHNQDGLRQNGPEVWRQDNWKSNVMENPRTSSANLMFGGMNGGLNVGGGGTGNSWQSSASGHSWLNPHTVDGGAWKRNLEDNARLSNDLYRYIFSQVTILGCTYFTSMHHVTVIYVLKCVIFCTIR